MKMGVMKLWLSGLCVLAASYALTGCDDGSSGTVEDAGEGGSGGAGGTGGMAGEGGTGGSGGEGGAGGTGGSDLPPVYGVVTTQRSSGGAPPTSYLILNDSLSKPFNLEDAVLEIPSQATAATPPGSGEVFVGTGAGEVIRYRYVEGELEETGKVSFVGQQVTAVGGYAAHYQFISETKAYYIGDDRIVIWNPRDMTTIGSILLPEMMREDPENPGTYYTTAATGNPLRIGDKLYIFIAWDSRAAGLIKVPGASGIAVVDTTADTAEFFLDEAGCGYGREGVREGDWLYVVTEAVGSSVHYLDPANGPKPCIRRFNMNTQSYDAGYTIDLNAVAGSAAGSLAITASGQALIHVLDEETMAPLLADGTVTNARTFASSVAWKTARLNLGDNPTVEILDTPLRSASVLQLTLAEDLIVTPSYGRDQALVEVTDDGIVKTDRTGGGLAGTTFSVVKIQ